MTMTKPDDDRLALVQQALDELVNQGRVVEKDGRYYRSPKEKEGSDVTKPNDDLECMHCGTTAVGKYHLGFITPKDEPSYFYVACHECFKSIEGVDDTMVEQGERTANDDDDSPEFCMLCDAPVTRSTGTAHFFGLSPKDRERLGRGGCFYFLCAKCRLEPDCFERAEAEILSIENQSPADSK
jgi:hypothetical protein